MLRRTRRLWSLIALAVALACFVFAVWSSHYAPGAGRLERIPSVDTALDHVHQELPFIHIGFDVALRKAYSLLAFAIVGALASSALRRRAMNPWRIGLLVAALSACIEVAQRLTRSHESLASSLFDIACGFIGGASGALVVRALRTRRAPPRRSVSR